MTLHSSAFMKMKDWAIAKFLIKFERASAFMKIKDSAIAKF